MHVVPGTGEVETFRPAEFDAFLRTAQSRVRGHLLAPFVDETPWSCDHCSRCAFIPVCADRWKAEDHLKLVASIRRGQAERLIESGVTTLAGLAAVPPDLVVAKLTVPALTGLHDQAGLQLHRRETGVLTRHLLEPEAKRGFGLLPPPSEGDIYFDMEGDPFFEAAGGLEFLFGVLWRTAEGGAEYRAFSRGQPSRGAAGVRGVHRLRGGVPRRGIPTCTSTTTPPTSRRR